MTMKGVGSGHHATGGGVPAACCMGATCRRGLPFRMARLDVLGTVAEALRYGRAQRAALRADRSSR